MLDDPFTDLTIRVQNNQDKINAATATTPNLTIKAHRSVLVNASRPFKSMLTQPLSENNATEITLKDLCATSLKNLITFIYGHPINIDMDTALPLHKVADQYEVLDLTHACSNFLIHRTTPENCCEILNKAEAACCQPVLARCVSVLRVNFDIVSHFRSFQLLSQSQLHVVLKGGLRTKSEERVLDALLRWVDYDPKTRSSAMLELAADIRWPFISPERLARLELDKPQLVAFPQMQEFLREAYRYQALQGCSDVEHQTLQCSEARRQASSDTQLQTSSPRQQDESIVHRFLSVRTSRRDTCHYFDASKLQFKQIIGDKGEQRGQFNCPEGIAFASDGRFAISDSLNHRVQVFDSFGNHTSTFGRLGSSAGEFNMPGGITFAFIGKQEHVLVCDQGNNRIQVFDMDGNFVSFIGQGQDALSLLKEPTGLVVSSKGEVFVCDYAHHKVQVFNLQSGEFLRSFGERGPGEGEFQRPSGIAFLASGHILVADYENNRLQVLSEQGKFIRVIGRFGQGNGEFERPFDIAVAPDGMILVTDYENHRVQVLDADGNFVRSFGTRGSGVALFDSPGGIAISQDGMHVGITDCSNCRVQIFVCDDNHQCDDDVSSFPEHLPPAPKI